MMMISNLNVYDLEEAVVASGYPMLADSPGKMVDAVKSDYSRAKALATTGKGEGHDNFLSGIVVSFDLRCSVKMWTEFERYHFAQIVSSQSTMHRLHCMDIDHKNFSPYVSKDILKTINMLQWRYIETKKEVDRLRLLYSCPTGLLLTARVTTNYRQLKTILSQRWNHTLPEWRDFCKEIIKQCPYAEAWIMPKGMTTDEA